MASGWSNEFRLAADVPEYAQSLPGQYKLAVPDMPTGPGMSQTATSAVGAGVQAAGATLGTIAQLAAQRAALQSSMQQADLSRAASEKMAKMQLKAEQEMFAGRKKDALQNMLLSAIQSNIGQISGGRDLRRSANVGMNEVLARAFLRR